jgi:hypothetical protein
MLYIFQRCIVEQELELVEVIGDRNLRRTRQAEGVVDGSCHVTSLEDISGLSMRRDSTRLRTT